ncbi:hypothetical protein VNO77_20067 [Canavalia gladiata]|uniref:Uncharacterized protein n=1 Tax=Canavalia gladiata TaxID=3824 RepID=A0AAN9LSJ5_CANGL
MEPPQSGLRGAEALEHISPGSSISVAYHSLFGPYDDLFLLEIDEKLLPDVLHERVVLRGQPDEGAVLCSCRNPYARGANPWILSWFAGSPVNYLGLGLLLAPTCYDNPS